MDITSLIVQLVGGVAGGNAVGKGVPNVDLGPLGNTIAARSAESEAGRSCRCLSQCSRAAAAVSTWVRSSVSLSAAARAARS
jgi:hypothetical protein